MRLIVGIAFYPVIVLVLTLAVLFTLVEFLIDAMLQSEQE